MTTINTTGNNTINLNINNEKIEVFSENKAEISNDTTINDLMEDIIDLIEDENEDLADDIRSEMDDSYQPMIKKLEEKIKQMKIDLKTNESVEMDLSDLQEDCDIVLYIDREILEKSSECIYDNCISSIQDILQKNEIDEKLHFILIGSSTHFGTLQDYLSSQFENACILSQISPEEIILKGCVYSISEQSLSQNELNNNNVNNILNTDDFETPILN